MILQNKHIFITGAGKRLGRALADNFLSSDNRLTAHYHQSKNEVTNLINQYPNRKIHAVSANLSQINELEIAIQSSTQALGPIDILINSASNFYSTPSLNVTEKDWDHLNDCNLKGHFFISQMVAKEMIRTDTKGVIIHFTDTNASHPKKNFSAYLAAKAGLLHLTRVMALEYAPNIRVNSISPGPVLAPPEYNPSQLEIAAKSTLLKRWGTSNDIVQGVRFLIQNSYITGFDLKIDGGLA